MGDVARLARTDVLGRVPGARGIATWYGQVNVLVVEEAGDGEADVAAYGDVVARYGDAVGDGFGRHCMQNR